jgi:hypothetical protein
VALGRPGAGQVFHLPAPPSLLGGGPKVKRVRRLSPTYPLPVGKVPCETGSEPERFWRCGVASQPLPGPATPVVARELKLFYDLRSGEGTR